MKPKINQLINKSVVQLKRGSPTVLTCLGVAGVIATTVSAVMATPKAIEKIRKDSLINHDGDPCGYSKTEAIKSAWVYYIPSTVIGVSTIICIVGANVLNRHQQAALSSAYALINKSYNEYKEKLKELYGEEAHQKIIDSIAKEHCNDVYLAKITATIMERRQRAMNSKIIRIIGLAATVIGLGANLINDWADEQKMNEQIDKKVNEALAKRDADAKES